MRTRGLSELWFSVANCAVMHYICIFSSYSKVLKFAAKSICTVSHCVQKLLQGNFPCSYLFTNERGKFAKGVQGRVPVTKSTKCAIASYIASVFCSLHQLSMNLRKLTPTFSASVSPPSSRQHCRLSICSYHGKVWQILNLRTWDKQACQPSPRHSDILACQYEAKNTQDLVQWLT